MYEDIAKVLRSVQLPSRNEQRMVSDVREAAQIVAQPPVVRETTPPEPPPHSIVTALHTLKDDMLEVVRTKKISLVHAAALEEDKRAVRPKVTNPVTPSRNRHIAGTVFMSALLILLGAAALFGIAYVVQSRSLPAQASEQSIVFSERSVVVQIAHTQPNTLRTAIASARADTSDAAGAITRIVPMVPSTTDTGLAQGEATLADFFAALGVQPPDELVRNLDSKFFFGFHMTDRRAPVFVIPVISYDNAVAGMLHWEKHINADLAPIFTAVPSTQVGADGIPVDRVFHDIVMHNYDVRVLQDDSGAAVLYYSFPSPSVLVIAENPFTFQEIINRLQAQRSL